MLFSFRAAAAGTVRTTRQGARITDEHTVRANQRPEVWAQISAIPR